MMDEKIKPGDHLKIARFKKHFCWPIAKVILVVLFFPIILLFYVPYRFVTEMWAKMRGTPLLVKIIICSFAFLAGLVVVPFAIVIAAIHIAATLGMGIVVLTFYTLCCKCAF